jgi:hypothetical protein
MSGWAATALDGAEVWAGAAGWGDAFVELSDAAGVDVWGAGCVDVSDEAGAACAAAKAAEKTRTTSAISVFFMRFPLLF